MFLDRLLSLCAKNNTDISNVLRALGLSTSKGTAWRKGSIPNGEILLMLAEYFSTSTDYLLGNTDDPRPAGEKEKLAPQGERIADEDVKAAFFHGADPTLTEEEMENLWEDAKNYMMYKISQRSRKNENEQ